MAPSAAVVTVVWGVLYLCGVGVWATSATTMCDLHPVLFVPGVYGSILQAEFEGGDVLRVWHHDSAHGDPAELFRRYVWGVYNTSTALLQPVVPLGSPSFTIVVPDDDYGLYAIETLDPDHPDLLPSMGPLIRHFENVGHIRGETLFGFPYDWRLSLNNPSLHASLASRIRTLSTACGGMSVDVVSHQTGTLLVRAMLLRSTGEATLIRNWISVGAPHRGAPGVAFTAFLLGHDLRAFGIPREMTMQLCVQSPMCYELLPPFNFTFDPTPSVTLLVENPDGSLEYQTRVPDEYIAYLRAALATNQYSPTEDSDAVDSPFNEQLFDASRGFVASLPRLVLPFSLHFFNIYGIGVGTNYSLSYYHPISMENMTDLVGMEPAGLQRSGDGWVAEGSAANSGFYSAPSWSVASSAENLLGQNETFVIIRDAVMDDNCTWEGHWDTGDFWGVLTLDAIGGVISTLDPKGALNASIISPGEMAGTFRRRGGLGTVTGNMGWDCNSWAGTWTYIFPSEPPTSRVEAVRIQGSECDEPCNCTVEHGAGTRACLAGFYSLHCIPTSCNAGYYPLRISAQCDACPVGMYKEGSGDACQYCGNAPLNAVYYAENVTTSDCPWKCEPGCYKQDESACEECPVGFFSDEVNDWSMCLPCTNAPEGAVYVIQGMNTSACTWDCGPGYMPLDTDSTCMACFPGSYKEDTGPFPCLKCTNGPSGCEYTEYAETSSLCKYHFVDVQSRFLPGFFTGCAVIIGVFLIIVGLYWIRTRNFLEPHPDMVDPLLSYTREPEPKDVDGSSSNTSSSTETAQVELESPVDGGLFERHEGVEEGSGMTMTPFERQYVRSSSQPYVFERATKYIPASAHPCAEDDNTI